MKVKRNSRSRKPPGWSTRLELSEDVREVETVRWLFETYLQSTCSIRSLVVELNRRGVISPRGVSWSHQHVKFILTNRTYIGTSTYGFKSAGVLHQVTATGEIGPPSKVKKLKPAVMVEKAHPAIISVEMFEAVQEKMQTRSFNRTKPRNSGAILSGLVYCGACGRRMYGHAKRQKKSGRDYLYYTCPSASVYGTCEHYSISAKVLDEYIVDLLKQRVCSPEAIRRLRQKIERQKAERSTMQPARVKSLKAQVDELSRKIKRGVENLLVADTRNVPEMSDALNALRTQRAGLEAELEGIDVASKPPVSADAAIERLERLAEVLAAPNRAKVRDVLHALIERVELWFRRDGTRFKLAKGNCVVIGPGQNSPFGTTASSVVNGTRHSSVTCLSVGERSVAD